MDILKVSRGMITKILLSVCVLSLFLLSLSFLFQFLNQFSINKPYVFLFCNGLMVFIAKNSSLPSDNNSSSDHLKEYLHQVPAPVIINSQEHDDIIDDEEEEEEKTMIVAASQAEEGEEKRIIVTDSNEEDEFADREQEWVDESDIEDEVADTEKKEEEEGEGSNINGIWITEEEEEHEEVEELNKICEDFIKKMKAAFCSEPRCSNYSDFDHHTAMVTVR